MKGVHADASRRLAAHVAAAAVTVSTEQCAADLLRYTFPGAQLDRDDKVGQSLHARKVPLVQPGRHSEVTPLKLPAGGLDSA